ncbi:DNA-processing protein DprA [bacterium]|nr:DNA-processing protein DprA [bacterium]
MLVHWIWLAHRPGLSDRAKVMLLQHFQDPEDIFFADDASFDYVGPLSQEARQSLRDKDLRSAEAILEACSRDRLQILTYRDASYPARLRNIPDPPAVLYYKGRLPDLEALPVIAVVGTRKASAYGLTSAKRLGYQIARCGGIVVSGMAFGIDAMAMTGALSAGLPVVGVLGCGPDVVYPPSNRSLFADVEAYGCIMSEYPPGTPPVKWNFPKRNRIISGLACGVLVVEAPERSGALITARQAAEQGRDVFVVPGNIDQPTFVGSNRLLRDGAIAVSSGWDILSEYEGRFPDKIRKDQQPARMTLSPEEFQNASPEDRTPSSKVAQKPLIPGQDENLKKDLDKKVIDKEQSASYSDVNDISKSLSDDEQVILAALDTEPRLVDEVIAETGLTTGKLLAAMTMLELKGILRRLPGKRVALTDAKQSQ